MKGFRKIWKHQKFDFDNSDPGYGSKFGTPTTRWLYNTKENQTLCFDPYPCRPPTGAKEHDEVQNCRNHYVVIKKKSLAQV